jgi:hypothetical protein
MVLQNQMKSKHTDLNETFLAYQQNRQDFIVKTDGRVGTSINSLFVSSLSKKKIPIYPTFLEEKVGSTGQTQAEHQ